MSIKVTIHNDVLDLSNLSQDQSTAEVKGHTVGQCLNDLFGQFPTLKPVLLDKDGKLSLRMDVLVNSESSFPEELNKLVTDNDDLYITTNRL